MRSIVARGLQALAAVVVFGSAGPLVAQGQEVGQVKAVSGSVTIVRGDSAIAAVVGFPLRESDQVQTGADGRLGVTLRDETRLSFGPNTRLELSRFAFSPAEDRLALTLRLVRGTLSYISGRIAKLAPGAVAIETPTSVIGVRGTHLAIEVH